MISTGALLGATNMKNPTVGFIIAIGAWLLFVWHLTSRSKKRAQRRQQERQFEQWMYDKKRNHSY